MKHHVFFYPKSIILILFITLLYLPAINTQNLSESPSPTNNTQTPEQKLEQFIQLAKEYRQKKDFPAALECWAKVMQLNRSLGIYYPFVDFSLEINKIVFNTNLENLDLWINDLDKEVITPEFLNVVSQEVIFSEHSHKGDYALKLAEEALQKSLTLNDTSQQACSYYYIGQANSMGLHDYEKARIVLTESKKLYAAVKDSVEIAYVLTELAEVEWNLGNDERYEQILEEAISWVKYLDNPYLLFYLKHNQIRLLVNQGKFEESLRLAKLAYKPAEELNIPHYTSLFTSSIAEIFYLMGRIHDSKKWYKKNIEYCLQGKKDSIQWDYKNILIGDYYHYALCYQSQGVYDSAVYFYQKSLDVNEEYNKNLVKYQALYKLTELSYEIQDTTAGRKYADEVNKHLEDLYQKGDILTKKNERIVLEWKVMQYKLAGQLDSAIYYTKQLLNFKDPAIKFHQSFIQPYYLRLGGLYFLTGNTKIAKQQFQKLLQLVEAKETYWELSYILYNLARIFTIEENYDRALELANQSLEIADQYGHEKTKMDVCALLSTINFKNNNFELAYRYQITSDSLQKVNYGFVQRNNVAKYEAQYRLKENKLEKEQLKLEKEQLRLEKERQSDLLRQRGVWLVIVLLLLVAIVILGMLYNQKSKLLAQNKLREQIAKDIHDDVAGSVGDLIRTAKHALDTPKTKATDGQQIVNLGDEILLSLKDLIWKTEETPQPLYLIEQEIRNITKQRLQTHQFPYELSIKGFDQKKQLSPHLHIPILMIYKEVLQNVVKHGAKELVEINWSYEQKTIYMKVENQFLPPQQPQNDVGSISRGMKNMRERAAMMGGKVKVDSSNNRFTVTLIKDGV